MLLSQDQIKELLELIENHTNIFIAKHIGSEYLSEEEKIKLNSLGIHVDHLYDQNIDLIKQSFYFGLISDALGNDVHKLSFEDLRKHFILNHHIPLTNVEKYTLDSIKKQFLGDIKANKNKIFNDVNGIITDKEKNNRLAYEKVIRDEISDGYLNNKTYNEIAREIAKKTGDWSRNFGRIVEYVSHQAMNEGRLAAIEKQDNDSKCYFDVFEGACKHCIKLYLTSGLKSKPIVFKISELKANGTNIGKKIDDWKATIGPIHPHCRCLLNFLPLGYEWDEKLGKFEIRKVVEIKNRKPIKFIVRIKDKEKEYFV